MNNPIKNMIAITLQNTISILGFFPNDEGDYVKDTLKELHPLKVIQLGLTLEECQKKKSFNPLIEFCKIKELTK